MLGIEPGDIARTPLARSRESGRTRASCARRAEVDRPTVVRRDLGAKRIAIAPYALAT
jgi:hypothetical protein